MGLWRVQCDLRLGDHEQVQEMRQPSTSERGRGLSRGRCCKQRCMQGRSSRVPRWVTRHCVQKSSTLANKIVCIVDGVWSGWTFGECDASCGGGRATGQRNCDNPAPAHNGRDCDGEGTTVVSCNQFPCRDLSQEIINMIMILVINNGLFSCSPSHSSCWR